MKTAAFIFFLFFYINTFAQSVDSTHSDTSKNSVIKGSSGFVIRDPKRVSKADKPLIIVDDNIYTKGISSINPDDILSLSVLKGDTAIAIYGTQAVNGVVIITLKSFAVESYKKTFSKFSKNYKKYLTEHSNDDQYCFYIINGKGVIEKGTNDRIVKLYQISKKQITYIGATSNPYVNGNIDNKEMVTITTK